MLLALCFIFVIALGIWFFVEYDGRCPECGSEAWEVRVEPFIYKSVKLYSHSKVCKKCGYKKLKYIV